MLRTVELRGGMWAELDWSEALWRIEAPRMKKKRANIVPLVPQAIALLHELQEITGSGARMLPNLRGDRRDHHSSR